MSRKTRQDKQTDETEKEALQKPRRSSAEASQKLRRSLAEAPQKPHGSPADVPDGRLPKVTSESKKKSLKQPCYQAAVPDGRLAKATP